MSTLVEVRAAAFGYRGKPILRAVDLTLQSGELLGIAGPNGAGKSTLFRGLLGWIPPLAGTVTRYARAIGYVPQKEVLDELYPLSVLELVCMGGAARLRGLRRVAQADRDLATDSLERVGLPGFAPKVYSRLSGGQRQRALIARALMVRPDLLLLDEPTSGVDDQAAQTIFELLVRLALEEGVGIAIVSHQLELLRTYCPRIAWVANAQVRVGPASEILTTLPLGRA